MTAITKSCISAGVRLITEFGYNSNWEEGVAGALMKSSVVKRSIAIDGHKTSISLENAFWTDLKNIAHTQQTTLSELVTKIDQTREGQSILGDPPVCS